MLWEAIAFLQLLLLLLFVYLWRAQVNKTRELHSQLGSDRKGLQGCALKFPVMQSSINSIHTEVEDVLSQMFQELKLITENNQAMRTSGEVAAQSAEEAAQASSEFGEQINTMSAATEELSVTIHSVAEGCQQAANETSRANTNVKQLRKAFLELSGLVSDVGGIVSIIQDIAAQTNLLALNATIEAATAGEAGKGFAVVASEVKDLARQSASSASKIDEQIQKILKKVEATDENSSTLLGAIDQLEKITMQIASTSTQQAQASQQLSENLSQFSSTGTEIASQVEALSTTVQEMALKSGNVLQICQKSSSILEERARSGLESIRAFASFVQDIVQQNKASGAFDIVAIKKGHMDWYKKVQGLLQGTIQLKPEEVTSHKTCGLGKWYFGEDSKELSKHPQFQELGNVHEKVHAAAQGVAKAVANHDFSLAKDHVKVFEQNRSKLFGILDNIYLQSVK